MGANLQNLSVPLRSTCSVNVIKKMKFCLINCRSVCNKTDVIKDFVVDNDLDIVAMTETWLKPGNLDTFTIGNITPTGYLFKHVARDTRGGSVGLLHKASLRFDIESIGSNTNESFEAAHMKLKWRATTVFLVILYRPPSSNSNLFLREFGSLLEHYVTLPGALMITGDFNIHVDDSSDASCIHFLQLLDSFNLKQHVGGSTHRSGHTLDLIITRDDEDLIGPLTIINNAISDHYAINCCINLKKPPLPYKTVFSRKIKSVDIVQLKSDIMESLCSKIESMNDVHTLVTKYSTELTSLLDVHAPLRKRRVVIRPAAPWYNDDIKNAKRLRRRLERRYLRSHSPVDFDKFVQQSNVVKELLQSSRSSYYKDLINDHKDQPRKMFNTVGKLLHTKSETSSNLFPVHTSTNDLVETFMQFFDGKPKIIHQDLMSQHHGEIFLDASGPATCKFGAFEPVGMDTLLALIKPSCGKSCSLDPIPGSLLRGCLPEVFPTILKIVNLSLQTAVVPDQLKVAVVRPMLKKPSLDYREFKNFRPISNLPFLAKVIEKVVAQQLTIYLDNNNLQEVFQSAYKRGHSAETALLRIHNDILTAVDDRQSVILILLDISAAFDTLDHGILLSRLKNRFGICNKALDWFSSYLSNRHQFVNIDGKSSTSYKIEHGVPQGSVLGPLLFSLYTSPLGDIARSYGLTIHFYADDTQVYITFDSSDPLDTEAKRAIIEACVYDIKRWLWNNRLKLNGDKSEVLVISSSRRPRPTVDSVCIDGDVVHAASSARNIGVVFDSSMSLVAQVTSICKSACFHLRAICKIRRFLDDNSTALLLHAFVISRLDYCNSLLFGLPNYVINRLQLIQNSAARLVFLSRKHDHVTPLLISLHWLPVQYRIKFKILLITHKVMYGEAPQYLRDLISPYVPARCLRSKNKNILCQPTFNLKSYGQRAFRVCSPRLWNDLPNDLRQESNLNSFKKKLKTLYFKKAFLLSVIFKLYLFIFVIINFFLFLLPVHCIRVVCKNP